MCEEKQAPTSLLLVAIKLAGKACGGAEMKHFLFEAIGNDEQDRATVLACNRTLERIFAAISILHGIEQDSMGRLDAADFTAYIHASGTKGVIYLSPKNNPLRLAVSIHLKLSEAGFITEFGAVTISMASPAASLSH